MRATSIRRLLSVGSILADIRLEAPHLPKRGGDVIGSTASISAGGGFNVLAAAARNGLKSAFAGQHGVGPFGDRIRADLAREKITALLPPCPDGDSGFCVVLVEPDGERTFITSPGVEAEIGDRNLEDIELRPSDAVFVSGYDLNYPALGPEIAHWIATWREEIFLAVDPGPLVASIPEAVLGGALARARLFTLNRREAALLAGTEKIGDIAAILTQRFAEHALLTIRSGAEGCFLCGGALAAGFVHIPAPSVNAVDTTGAGDAHTGVLLAAIAAGLDPISAATRANAAAAISVTRRGPATAPSIKELDDFLTSRNPNRHQKNETKAMRTMRVQHKNGKQSHDVSSQPQVLSRPL